MITPAAALHGSISTLAFWGFVEALPTADELRADSGEECGPELWAAMGVPREVAQGSLRLSLGYTTTPADIDSALAIIGPAVERLIAHGGG